MYFVYVLKNPSNKHYIGLTSNIEKRLKKHNTGSGRWTKYKGPWELAYHESFEYKKDAAKRECEIKSYKGGNAFKKLIAQ